MIDNLICKYKHPIYFYIKYSDFNPKIYFYLSSFSALSGGYSFPAVFINLSLWSGGFFLLHGVASSSISSLHLFITTVAVISRLIRCQTELLFSH